MGTQRVFRRTSSIHILFFSFNAFAEEQPVDIWNLEKKGEEDPSIIVSEDKESNEIKIDVNKIDPNNEINIIDSNSLGENKISIVGLYDPEDNGLNIDMWSSSDGNEIKLR